MVSIEKPSLADVESVRKILSVWTGKEEVDKYFERIKSEITGITEYNLQFWVAKEDEKVVGIAGLCDPLPKILEFAKTEKPGELKILYLNPGVRGKGIGKRLLGFVENEARNQSYKEILIRSAERYKDTAYGFYEKMDYGKVGIVAGSDSPEPMQVFEKGL